MIRTYVQASADPALRLRRDESMQFVDDILRADVAVLGPASRCIPSVPCVHPQGELIRCRGFNIKARARDLASISLRDNIAGLEITHISIHVSYTSMRFEAELTESMHLLAMIFGVQSVLRTGLRILHADASELVAVAGLAHISLDRRGPGYVEHVRVQTSAEGCFELSAGSALQHTYAERYGAAFSYGIREIAGGRGRFHQDIYARMCYAVHAALKFGFYRSA